MIDIFNMLLQGFLKTTNQPINYHQPPTTDHQPADHRQTAPITDQPTIDQ